MLLQSLSSSSEPDSLLAAAHWIEAALQGTVATSLAVLAFGWFGYGMLTGKVSVRRGGLLVLGAFIFFAAPLLARSLYALGESAAASPPGAAQVIMPPSPTAVPTPPAYDPYAGASVPG